MIAALVAALVVGLGQAAGWQGVDVAAQVYRVNSFRDHGFALWDFQWYGGHWTLNYSVVYPPFAAFLSVAGLAVGSAALAALAFDRLVRPRYPDGGRVASLVFAAGTLVPSSIGQLPFLTGAAFGLGAVWAATRNRWWAAWLLGLVAALTSPLAGAFVAMAAVAWLWCDWRTGGRMALRLPVAGLAAAGVAPVAAMGLLFPGPGAMPYPVVDYLWEMLVAGGLWILAGRGDRPVRAMCGVWMVAATVAVVVPSPVGGNVGRLEDLVALPVAVALVWSRRHAMLLVGAVPLALSQWAPAWGAVAAGSAHPSTTRSYFAPLSAELRSLSRSGPTGRVEVVPTAYHWEAAYVAPVMPLARGWERQLDVADNPVFYRDGALSAAAYRQWLLDNGVRYVALASAPLDMAGRAEGRLVAAGTVPGLQLVWRTASWRLYSVAGSSGIVSGPARLVSATGGRLVVDAPAAGSVVIRVRFSPDWELDGPGCVARTPGSWMVVQVPAPERFALTLSVLGADSDGCGQRLERVSALRPPVAAKTTAPATSTHTLMRTNGPSR